MLVQSAPKYIQHAFGFITAHAVGVTKPLHTGMFQTLFLILSLHFARASVFVRETLSSSHFSGDSSSSSYVRPPHKLDCCLIKLFHQNKYTFLLCVETTQQRVSTTLQTVICTICTRRKQINGFLGNQDVEFHNFILLL